MQAPNLGGRFDQLSFWFFMRFSHTIPLDVPFVWMSPSRSIIFITHTANRLFWARTFYNPPDIWRWIKSVAQFHKKLQWSSFQLCSSSSLPYANRKDKQKPTDYQYLTQKPLRSSKLEDRVSEEGRDLNWTSGYRLRWRSDIWRTDRGVAEVRSPDIRPATEDDIRHNAPGLFETVDQLLRTKVRRKLLNQDKPSRLASYALQQHKAKSARLAASEFSFLLLPFWDALRGCVQWSRRETKTLKLQQATEELGRERTARVTTMAWCLTL